MNGNRKFKSLRLVRFGDVLYDQQRRLIMLCRSCQRHYLSLDAFQAHLIKCGAIKHIVTSIDELQYDEERRESRLINGKQEMFIYEPDAVRNGVDCNIDWEAELEDPRWYTDDNRMLPTKAKQSPTNAKENVDEIRTRNQTAKAIERETQNVKQAPKKPQQQQQEQQLSQPSPAKRMRHSTPKRTILTNQKQQHKTRASLDIPKAKNDVYVVQNIIEDLRGLDALATARAVSTSTTTASCKASTTASCKASTTASCKASTTAACKATTTTCEARTAAACKAITTTYEARTAAACKATTATCEAAATTAAATNKPTVVNSTANGDTQQILNKLRACGVEVKRRNTRETLDASGADAATLAKKQQALDIMRKLQSNGIQCTKLNNARKGI
ncbi:pneumococcal serine-rich repeat protein [Drosophila grimshawi]|uniref:GH20798 n=1 Tax=Drosophila grimshawi TaxID=7222 RepID=B4J5Z6_DROGR|nr:pneumococcal serine-rich repeat protein [Drosophila grimshawi]EDW00839.1 GH20798 [Drosophila grimshawi]